MIEPQGLHSRHPVYQGYYGLKYYKYDSHSQMISWFHSNDSEKKNEIYITEFWDCQKFMNDISQYLKDQNLNSWEEVVNLKSTAKKKEKE